MNTSPFKCNFKELKINCFDRFLNTKTGFSGVNLCLYSLICVCNVFGKLTELPNIHK